MQIRLIFIETGLLSDKTRYSESSVFSLFKQLPEHFFRDAVKTSGHGFLKVLLR